MNPLVVGVARGKGSIESVELVWPDILKDLSDRKIAYEVRYPVPTVIVFVRGRDVAWLLREEHIDVAIVSSIALLEYGFGEEELLSALPTGVCRMSLITDKIGRVPASAPRIATRYPRTAKAALSRIGYNSASLITMSGCVEAAIILRLAEGVVDIVGSGATLQANGLREVASLLPIGHGVYARIGDSKTQEIFVSSFSHITNG